MKQLILIVDDDAKYRKLIRDVLEAAGYATVSAENGARAIELTRLNTFRLIIMDVQMTVMDGVAAVKTLKADPATHAIPVIAVTALAMNGDRERILAAGFDDYLGKPISVKELRVVVARHLDLEAAGVVTHETKEVVSV